MDINDLTTQLAKDPFDPTINFDIAKEYEKAGHTASAISFYLRSAEYGYDTHPDHTYSSLIKISECLASQGERETSVLNSLYQAVAYDPAIPIAYFFISQLLERKGRYQESYTWACMGLDFDDYSSEIKDFGYHGTYGFLYEKAVCGWHIGRKEESRMLFEKLLSGYDMAPEYIESCKANLTNIKNATK